MKEEIPKVGKDELPWDLQRIIIDPSIKTAKLIIEEKDKKWKRAIMGDKNT